jgi:hypothetical protein
MASRDGWDCCNIFEAVASKIAMRHWGKLLRHTFEARFVSVLTLFLLVRNSVCTISETRRPISGFTALRSWIVIESKVGTTCCERMGRRKWSPRALQPTVPRRKYLCAQVTRSLLGSRADMGVVSKRTILPLTGIEQRVFSKFTDWGFPANGYYKPVSILIKCYIMLAVPIPLTVKVLILNTLCSLSSDAGPRSLNSGLHKEYPVYGHQCNLCYSCMWKATANMEWITRIWHAFPRTSSLF